MSNITLTLRVTSDKRKPKAKLSSAKDEDIHHIVESIRTTTQDLFGSSEYLNELEKAKDVKAQLEKLKQGSRLWNLENEDKEIYELFYYTVLVELLLSLKLKSPLRSGIIRILKDFNDTKSMIIKKMIADGLKLRFSHHNNNISVILTVTNTLCGCFDNFSLGVESVRICCEEAYNFIVNNLTICTQTLSKEASPAENVELCQCIHVLVRAALNICSLNQSSTMAQLHKLTLDLLSCNQLPLDTRTNCGLLVVTTSRQCWLKMLEYQLKSEDDMTSLCLYTGLISCLSVDELSVQKIYGFGEKTALQLIFDKVMEIQSRNLLQPTLTLSVARTLVGLSRVLLSHHSYQLQYMLPRLLSYTWEHLEHAMDSVKHLTAVLLHNIVKLHSPEVDVYGAIQMAIKGLLMWGRAKHTALSTLIGKVPTVQLINSQEDINCFYEQLNQEVISSHAVNAFKDLLKHHYLESGHKDEWKELWIKPLLQHLDHNPSVPLQQILNKAVAVCPDIVEYILRLTENQVTLRTTLLCVQHAHKLGLLDTTEKSVKWRGIVDYYLLREAIHDADEQTRLSCLSLVVEGPKTTEAFTLNELELIKDYVSCNLNMESPASRQRNIALLTKFVTRFNDSEQVLFRKLQLPTNTEQLIQSYKECREWLEQSCIDSLFPGATYSRRVTALHLLTAMTPAATPALSAALLCCLTDSYEDVKGMAMKLLNSTPNLLSDFTIPSKLLTVIEESIEQAGGNKPRECLTAAYLLATISHIQFSQNTLTAIIDQYKFPLQLLHPADIEHYTVYCCLLIILEHLTQQLSVAQVSLLKAASSAPLYGLLFTAKLILSQINLRECRSKAWCQLISRVLELCFGCCHAVSSVVNSDSPEGHFPMDFDFDPAELCGGVEDGMQNVTSQMVLLCSWRTVKEVSLLLGYLVEEASIFLSSEDTGLLSNDDVLKIGVHFITLLSETKHRGAFEQAYVGFCKLVSRLWRLPSGYLQELPEVWLEDTMQEICSNEENLCATRRSAGIPFMIQALICTKLEVEGLLSIETWVCRLLDMAENATLSPTTHTHALNILRALFRNTQLGEAVSIFVERAFIITISAFSANTWMERNSATLLLSALMTRVFGVPRSKSQEYLSWKNKMTGRIFFQRYPKLFSFFQEELRKASLSKNTNLHPSLYPVLLIFGRLYPSSLEGTDSNIQLAQYIPDILVCAGSNIYKTRVLAATAMLPLMTFSHFDSVIVQVTKTDLSANLRHGLLLQVVYFLKHSNPKIDQQMFKNKANTWITHLIDAFASKYTFVELETLFQIFNIFCEKYFELVSGEIWMHLMVSSRDYLKITGVSKHISSCLLRERICELLLKITALRGCESLADLCFEMLKDDMYEVKHIVLDFICSLNSDINCPKKFCKFVKHLTPLALIKCKSLIFDSSDCFEMFKNILLDMLVQKSVYNPEDKAKILLVLSYWKSMINSILGTSCSYPGLTLLSIVNLCKDSNESVAFSAIYCLAEFIYFKETAWEEEDLTTVCELLIELTKPDVSEVYHVAVYDLLSRHFDILQKSRQSINRLRVYKTYIQLSDCSQWQLTVERICECESDVVVKVVLLCALTLGQFQQQDIHQQNVVGRVFDKGEFSDVYEEYILSKICGPKLARLCDSHKDLLCNPLHCELRHWLSVETGLKGETFDEFLALAKIQVLLFNPEDPHQILRPGYQLKRLNSLKLKNIL